MPKISLRAYNREISNLIDKGQTEEAVAHCQYILQTYPKHLESYRLLGKAYLEAHRYSDAIDIFQRVLAVVPDDFVTHVGMSIIRNDENNLEAAIWHMERAFEVQPSNQAIQDELKHLYGRQRGEEPQKIRLTRGALCRMYARGNQTRQAIAEIKTILAEEPERLDMQVLLARMYYLANMNKEAEDLSHKILGKAPYCYDSNKLMVEVLSAAKKVKEIEPYRQKIFALDPYEAFISDPSSRAEEVPDDAVLIDKLHFDGVTHPTATSSFAENQEGAPDWLISDLSGIEDLGATGFTRILDSSILPGEGEHEEEKQNNTASTQTQPVVVEPTPDEPLPDWLRDTLGEPASAPQKSSFEDIPDFLKATGWAAAGTIDENTPPSQVIPTQENETEGEAAPGNIPDWLKSLAPQTDNLQVEESPKADDFSKWLNELDNSKLTVQHTDILSEDNLNEPDADSTPLPDWLQETARSADFMDSVPTSTHEPSEKFPAQAAEFPATSDSQDSVEDKTDHQPKPTGSLKFAVDENFPIAGGTTILSPDDLPDWLQNLKPSGEPSRTDAASVFSTEQPLPYKPPVSHPEGNPEIITTRLSPNEKEEIPEWLKDIQPPLSDHGFAPQPSAAEPEDISTKQLPESEKEEIPEWLKEISDQQAPPVQTLPVEPSEMPAASLAPDNEIPDWLAGIRSHEEENLPPIPTDLMTNQLTPEEKSEMPEWLNESAVEPPVSEPMEEAESELENERKTAVLPEEEEGTEEQMPEWLHMLEQFSNEPADEAPESGSVVSPIPGDELPPMNQQPAETATDNEEDKPTTSILPPNPEEAEEELPEWLRDIDGTAASKIAEENGGTTANGEDFPDWLKSFPVASAPIPTDISGPEESTLDETLPSELPSWMEESIEEEADIGLPDWLKDFAPGAKSPLAVPQEGNNFSLPEWLEETSPSQAETAGTPAAPEIAPQAEISAPPKEERVTPPWEASVQQPLPVEESGEGMESGSTLAGLESIFGEPSELKGTQELTPEWTEAEGFKVPPDSILSDESAAAAVAAIGIPLFAEGSTAPQADEKITRITPVEETEPTAEEVLFETSPEAQESAEPVWAEEPEIEPLSTTAEKIPEAPMETSVSEIDVVSVEETAEPAELSKEAFAEEVQPLEAEAPAEVPEPGMESIEQVVSARIDEILIPFEQTEKVLEPEAETEAVPELKMSAGATEEFEAEVTVPAGGAFPGAPAVAGPAIPEMTLDKADFESILEDARAAVLSGDLERATPGFSTLIRAEHHLTELIPMVEQVLQTHPFDFNLWVILGDAYGRSGSLQKALDAYSKAEEYLQ